MPRDEIKEFRAAGGPVRIAAADESAEGGAKLGTFAGVAYTGAVMQPGGWYGSIICDLAGIKVPQQHRPVLRQHDDEQIVGHTTGVTVTDQGVEIEGVFSGEPAHTAKVTVPAKNGFQWQLSIGAVPLRTEFLEAGQTTTVNGREVTGPLTISRETELKEISFVPLGADGNTTVSVSASHRRGAMFKSMLLAAKQNGDVKAGKYSEDDINKMSEEEAKSALKKMMDEETDHDESKAKAKAKAEDEEKKTDAEDEEKKPEAKAAANAAIKAMRSELAAEQKRVSAIQAKAKSHPKILAKAIEEGWSAEKTELEVLRAERPGAGVGGVHIHLSSQAPIDESVLECAVFQAASPTDFRLFDDSFYTAEGVKGRGGPVAAHIAARTKRELAARYPDRVQQAAHDHFKGRIGLQRLLRVAAAGNGHHGRDVDWSASEGIEALRYASGEGFRADGTSNYSLSNLLANVLGKMMLSGYLFVESAYREVSASRPVNDFKQVRGINLFSNDIMYDAVGSTGELKNASLRDQAFTNQAEQYGKIMTIDRKAIINDDLGALTTVPQLLGRGAALKLNAVFWSTFLNPGKDNGGSTDFFAATHTINGEQAASNLITGGSSVLSSTSLQSAVTLFDKQVDPAGFPLGVDAEVLLYPPELDQVAWELLNSTFIVAGGGSSVNRQPSNNRWVGKFKPVKSRYLSNTTFTGNSATAWYLLANPGVLPVAECVFLNGVDTPTVQQAGIEYQFDRLGISVRGVFDFGVNMQNFRGGVKSNGA